VHNFDLRWSRAQTGHPLVQLDKNLLLRGDDRRRKKLMKDPSIQEEEQEEGTRDKINTEDCL